MIEKLVINCDSLDYYILCYETLGLDLSLVGPKYNRNILHLDLAAWNGRNVAIIEWILKKEIISDINAVDWVGWTCLHYLMGHIYRSSCSRKNKHKKDYFNKMSDYINESLKHLITHKIV